MDRIDHPTAVDIGGGRRGFRSKDTVAGLPGTVATATHLNAQQEEILAVIEASGQVPDGADLTQLLKAIRLMTAGNLRTVVLTAASGNLPIPADVSVLNWIRAGGGGGAGGNSNTTNSKASGGGGGAFFDLFNVPVTPGSNVPYTVGAAGVPSGLGAGFNGGAGGSTAILGRTAGGGAGGLGANNNTAAIQVAGGAVTGSARDIDYPGGLGTEGNVGTGGGTVLSQPTQRAFTNAGVNNAANNWGGGGPGGSDFSGVWQPGGAGKPGIIIIQYFSRFAP